MPYASLGEFLAELQDNDELVRIPVQVDSALELAAITDRVAKSSPHGGPALLFENVKNSTIPVLTNLLGSRRRLCRCLGVTNLDEVSANLDRRLASEGGWLDSLKLVPGWGSLEKWSPKSVKTAVSQQVVRLGRDVSLWDLPVPRSWPGESHPVLTSGKITSRHPVTGVVNLFQVPLMVTGPQELALYDGNEELNALINSAKELSQNLAVSINLGGDPVLDLLPAFPGIGDARSFAGLLRGMPLELVRCRTNDLEVPAGAEMIIEGYIDAAKPKSEMPLSLARGNGRYVEREFPLIQVTAITHRANPILPAMITAPPSSEESWITLARERMLLPLLKRRIPEIADIHQPFCAAGRNLLFVSIHKTTEHQSRRVLHALWGMEVLNRTKMIIVVDADQDLTQEDQVWFTVGTHACPSRDFVFADGQVRDDDYTSVKPFLASQVGIDATRKRYQETNHPWPQSLTMSDEIAVRLRERWTEYGL